MGGWRGDYPRMTSTNTRMQNPVRRPGGTKNDGLADNLPSLADFKVPSHPVAFLKFLGPRLVSAPNRYLLAFERCRAGM